MRRGRPPEYRRARLYMGNRYEDRIGHHTARLGGNVRQAADRSLQTHKAASLQLCRKPLPSTGELVPFGSIACSKYGRRAAMAKWVARSRTGTMARPRWHAATVPIELLRSGQYSRRLYVPIPQVD